MKPNSFFPSGKIAHISGQGFALKGDDIDTDRIIPARFLKCVNFDSLGENVFADDRNELQGSHPFDRVENQGCSLLIVNSNFGCGSSREHAPQALMRWGIRGIIGESFAEIFYGNCLSIGIPCATTSKSQIDEIQHEFTNKTKIEWELSLDLRKLFNQVHSWNLEFDERARKMLMSGQWDATSQLISNKNKIIKTINKIPYLKNFET